MKTTEKISQPVQLNLIPQKIYTKSSVVENKDNMDSLAARTKKVARIVGRHLNDLIIVPAGLLAIIIVLLRSV